MNTHACGRIVNFLSIEVHLRNLLRFDRLQYFRDHMAPRTGSRAARPLSESPSYVRDWCRRPHFCPVRSFSLWILDSEHEANVDISDFSIWMREFLPLSRSQIHHCLNSVRYFHGLPGYPSFHVTLRFVHRCLIEISLSFDIDRPLRVGGSSRPLDLYIPRVLSTEKLRALMAGLRTGASALYIASWRHRPRFCEIRCIEPWFLANHPGWAGNLPDYNLLMRGILSVIARTVAGHISGIRYFHVIARYHAFGATGPQIRIVRKSLTAGIPPDRKLPPNVDLLSWLLRHYYSGPSDPDILSTCGATSLSFFFLLRTSACRNLLVNDVSIFGTPPDKPNGQIRIFIRSSKTDHSAKLYSAIYRALAPLCVLV